MRTGRVWWVVLLCLWALPAFAQEYRFSVPECEMDVHVRPSGEVRIVYDFLFANLPGAHPIDVVDIGLPHRDYDLSTMVASRGGESLTDIRDSGYVQGVEVHLGNHAIRPGKAGRFHFECTMSRLIYQDTTRDDYASFQITPTWFGSQYVVGTTNLTIRIHLPSGIQKEEILYQDRPFTGKPRVGDHFAAVWGFSETRLTEAHRVGVSFPKRAVERIVVVTNWDLLREWYEGGTGKIALALFLFLLWTFLYFRFTGGTGWFFYCWGTLFFGPMIMFFSLALFPGLDLLVGAGLLSLLMLNEWYLRTRRAAYLPAIASVEGGGIKRGLTAPEAAILLERPLQQVLGLVLFGMLEKGILHQTDVEPFRVEISPVFRTSEEAPEEEQETERREAAREEGVVLRDVELAVLAELEPILRENPETPVEEMTFKEALEGLIEKTVGRLEGFDLDVTRAYYRRIVGRAVTEAREVLEATEVERAKLLDEKVEWLLLHDDADARRSVLGTGRAAYHPAWFGGSKGRADAGGGGSASGGTSLTDVAASFAGWTENTFGQLAGAVSPDVYTTPAGVIDLSKIDAAMASGSGSSTGGSSGGGGCACACAGCACACACAGGGR